MKTKQPILNRQFHKLTVIAPAEPVGYNKRWLCRCDCGNETIVYQSALCQNRTQSCGCYNKEASKQRRSKGWIHILTKELLEEEHIKQKKTLREIAREKGCSVSCVMKYMRQHELQSNEKLDDLVDAKFGMLKVLQFDHNDHNTSYWKVRCDCGKELVVQRGALVRGKQVSCGCYNKNKDWKGCGDLSKTYWTRIAKGAESRNLEFNITIEYGWELFEKQKGLCALSNIQLIMDRQFSQNLGPNKKQTASLDRIDPTRGYVVGNVQWTHYLLNRMKSDFQTDEFVSWCKLVSLHHTTT